MHCIKCDRVIQVARMAEGQTYCETCFRIVYPAFIAVIKKWHSPALFCPTINKYLSYSLNYYETCGFQLHKHKIFLYKNFSPAVKEFMLLRYFGKERCNLIKHYNWANDSPACLASNCTATANRSGTV
jgi:hypothetical protein